MPTAAPGYTALHESAAWMDLSARGKIRVTGEDRVRLLHAILSNDVGSLEPGQGNYQFLLDAQGHILADANLYLFADHVLLDVEPGETAQVMEHIDRYIIADDVQLEDATASLATIALEGPEAEKIAQGAIGPRTSLTGQPGVWFFLDPAGKGALIERLECSGAGAATADDAKIVRVENGLPRYGDDFGATNLPQETRQESRAVSFTKGCYLGQEIVERIRARGQVHRVLAKIAIEGEDPPQAGTAVAAGGQEIGKLTSPVYSPRLGQALGLAIVRREFAAPGTAVTIGGRPGRVID
jgi:folate-binding protein YgfZ